MLVTPMVTANFKKKSKIQEKMEKKETMKGKALLLLEPLQEDRTGKWL